MTWITGINNIDIKKYYKKVEVDTIVDGIETVIDNDVYTKTEIAAIVASENAIDSAELTNFYNKFETVVLLDGKADKTNVYTKTENNDMLNLKSNIVDVTSALLLKSNVTDVTASLGLKADLTALNNGLSLKADLTALTNGLSLKADSTALTNGLALKADLMALTNGLSLKADSTALTNGLSLKADSTALTNGLSLKADSTALTDGLSLKADSTALTNGLALKADSVALINGLALKYNITDANTALGLKANITDMNSSLLLKSNVVDTNAALSLKSNVTDVTASFGLKADKLTTYTKTETETALNLKSNVTDVTASLGLKADKLTTYTKTENDNLLNLKANQTTTYTKTETDTALNLKSNVTDVTASLGLKADKLTTYTKTENDNQLNLKANSADVSNSLTLKADKLTTYTKTETNNLLNDKVDNQYLIDNYVSNTTVSNLLLLEEDVTAFNATMTNYYNKTETDNLVFTEVDGATNIINDQMVSWDAKIQIAGGTERRFNYPVEYRSAFVLASTALDISMNSNVIVPASKIYHHVQDAITVVSNAKVDNATLANYYTASDTSAAIISAGNVVQNTLEDVLVSWNPIMNQQTERRFNYPVEYRSAFVTGSTDLNVVANSNVIVPAGKIHQYLLDNYVSNQWLIDNYVSNSTVTNLLALEQDITAFNAAIANYPTITQTDNKISTAINGIKNYVFQQPVTLNIYDGADATNVIANCTTNHIVLEHLGYPFYWVTLNIHLVITPSQNYGEICLLLPFDTAIVNPTHNIYHGSLFFEQYVPNPGYVPYFANNDTVFVVSRQNSIYQRYVYFYRTNRPSEDLAGTYLSIYANNTYTITGQITYLANLSGQNNYSLPL